MYVVTVVVVAVSSRSGFSGFVPFIVTVSVFAGGITGSLKVYAGDNAVS